jgi:hypothetical protein
MLNEWEDSHREMAIKYTTEIYQATLSIGQTAQL